MGSYTFEWEHEAEEAFVTGTFDDWQKSVRLQPDADGVFRKTVELGAVPDKVYYKFVVDNNWTINESAPHEADADGNVNNFLTPDALVDSAAMAGKKNKQRKQASKQTLHQPADAAQSADTSASEGPAPPTETAPAHSAKEAAATPSGLPGGFPATPAEDDKPVGINPMPAAPGAVNPIKLEPGQKIPDSITSQDVDKYVKLDKESYEKSDALPGLEKPELPPISKNMIPESSLPIMGGDFRDAVINSVGPGATTAALAGQVPPEPKQSKASEFNNATINSVGPGATTAALAGQVPLESSKVSDVGKDGQDKAASAAHDVQDKASSTAQGAQDKAPAASKEGHVAAVAAEDTKAEKASPAVNDVANKNPPESVSPEVPSEVRKSIAESGQSPEAAASTTAVHEKKEVESELLKEVKAAPAVDDVNAGAASKPEAAKASDSNTPESKAAESKPAESKPAESKPAESKPAESKPAESKPAESKPAESKPAESKPEAAKAATPEAAAATNGAGKPASTSEQSSTAAKKKKNRLSTMFQKLKDRLSDKK